MCVCVHIGGGEGVCVLLSIALYFAQLQTRYVQSANHVPNN